MVLKLEELCFHKFVVELLFSSLGFINSQSLITYSPCHVHSLIKSHTYTGTSSLPVIVLSARLQRQNSLLAYLNSLTIVSAMLCIIVLCLYNGLVFADRLLS